MYFSYKAMYDLLIGVKNAMPSLGFEHRQNTINQDIKAYI